MPSYMLLLYNKDEDFQDISPDDMQGVIEKYKAWHDHLEDGGHLIGSDKLKDGEGRVLTRPNGKTRILDGPFTEAKEIVGGYFAVRADDYDGAVALCEDCPHLEYGGTVEVREIDEDH